MARKTFLLLFSLFTTLTSVWLALFLSETFFFDKLLYKKSFIHGYINNQWESIKFKNNFWIERRIRDLRTVVNQSGAQDKVLGARTTKDAYTIALIGDSFAYGTGVKENESFGRILEIKLNKIRPTRIYVLALPGDSIVEHYAKFLLSKSKINPDLYIYSMIDNDLIYDHDDKYPNEDKIYSFFRQSCSKPEFEHDYWIDEEWIETLKNVYAPSYSNEFANRCWVKVAVQNMVLENKRILFFSIFSSEDLDQSARYGLSDAEKLSRDLELVYIGLIESSGGTVVNRLEKTIGKWFVSNKERHPSKEFHQLSAESLFQEITTNSMWRF